MMNFAARLFLPFFFLAASSHVVAGSAEDTIKTATNNVINELTNDANKSRLENDKTVFVNELIETHIEPSLDFDRMIRSVLGKNWRKANDEQRTKFRAEFRTLLLRTYGNALGEYSGQKVKYLPVSAKRNSDEETLVKTELEQEGGFPVPVDYYLYKTEKGDWKVFDLSIDSVKLVANYRRSFTKSIRQEGLEKFLVSLAERNKQAAAKKKDAK